IFEAPVLHAQAQHIAQSQGRVLPALVCCERQAHMPLSFAQQRLWVVEQLDGASAAYNMQALLTIRGQLNIKQLELAINQLIARHEVLRTNYRAYEGEPVQVIHSNACFVLKEQDLRTLPTEHQQQEVDKSVATESAMVFDLANDLMLRGLLIRVNEEEYTLALITHHIACDDWSMQIMAKELCYLYRALAQIDFTQAEPIDLPALPLQYVDFSVWQKQCLQGKLLQQSQDFWQQYMNKAPSLLALPLDFPRPDVRNTHGGRVSLHLPLVLSRQLTKLANEHQVSLFMLLLAGYNLTLHRLYGLNDIVLGTDLAGRTESQLEGLIGFFINVLPIRTRIKGDERFGDWLSDVKQSSLSVFDNQQMPLDLLVETLKPARNKAYQPLVQSLFVMQNVEQAEIEIPGLKIVGQAQGQGAAQVDSKFDMSIFITETDTGIEINGVYQTALFRKRTLQTLMEGYRQILAQIVAAPHQLLSSYVVETTKEKPMKAMKVETKKKMPGKSKLGKLKKIKPLMIKPNAKELVKLSFVEEDSNFPVIVTPAMSDIDVYGWAESNREYINKLLSQHAGILFRDFPLNNPQDFERFANAIYPGLYGEYGDLPKKDGGDKTYKSTPYPEEQMILFHNESSHLNKWPMKQWFFSEVVANEGGATPIVDCREMYRQMPEEIIEKLEQKKLLYVRNFTKQLDVSWQNFFKTDSREVVEAKCREEGMEYEWLDNDGLQTRTLCPAIISHPITGEKSFFNQIQLHHIYFLESEIRESLLNMVSLRGMPRNVYYGDGSVIEDSVLALISKMYEACAVRLQWQAGDLIMVDNMLTAHARDPFKGERKIVVAMGDMQTRSPLKIA
ncbi:MAG: TauD/TfdA family dioxygenase, partial [Gammaproteobacteria bacterium]|nr:TauD/TfdA family dioxygenase [Gammaproteobacteria bacterium]